MNEAPQSIKDLVANITEMMETAEAVKGEAFTDLMRYMMNTRSLIKALHAMIRISIEENKNVLVDEDNFISDAVRGIITSNTKLFIDALDLNEQQVDEVMKHIEAINKKIDNVMKDGDE